MNRTMTRVRGWMLGLAFAVLPLAACMAPVGVSGRTIPKNAAKICAGHCRSIGMTLSAVAIMAENVGCVCQGGGDKDDEEAAGELSTPAAGMATIALQEEADAQQRRSAAATSGARH